MSFILKSPTGSDVQINQWHWHPTMVLIQRAIQLDEEQVERLSSNGCGGTISLEEAVKIADYVDIFLIDFSHEGRLLLDGSVTMEPKSDQLFRGEEWHKNYSTNYDWLARFRDFCRSSDGFKIS